MLNLVFSPKVVHRAVWESNFVAVKKFFSSCPSRMVKDFKNEIDILSKIKHENIVKLFWYCDKRDNTYLVSELMEGGSLYNHIHDKNNCRFNWSHNIKIINDIVKGMVYLHGENILHLDLKSLNILLSKDSKMAKISDFGLSQINTLTSTSSIAHNTRIAKGTTRYMACEIAKGQKPSIKSDIWSFGCILLEFVTRELPFASITDNAIFHMLQSDSAEIPLNFSTTTPQIIADLISKCLLRNPNERPSFNSIYDDVLKQVDERMLEITLKTQQIKIKSLTQDSKITNMHNLKSILDGIKTNNQSKNKLENEIQDLNKIVSALRLKVPEPYSPSSNYYGADEDCYAPRPYSQQSNYNYNDDENVTKPLNLSGCKSTGAFHISRGPANGRALFEGIRGGLFYLNSRGNRTYVPRDSLQNNGSTVSTGSTGSKVRSTGSATVRSISVGPRGGQFYINSKGNKTYI